ncbi:hypothetical protein C7T94_10835 [Pedobacter yulinensis]|uniref:Uncharacterized protein n=1 Tax=Pedobacter yulinensis TaxID=2126353 RepID=A0A2T3HKX8_9SPHI|nr:hypothetical protein C7T94_10835 [Pedobacter yulinensis]
MFLFFKVLIGLYWTQPGLPGPPEEVGPAALIPLIFIDFILAVIFCRPLVIQHCQTFFDTRSIV